MMISAQKEVPPAMGDMSHQKGDIRGKSCGRQPEQTDTWGAASEAETTAVPRL
jgi:hypothetical protein